MSSSHSSIQEEFQAFMTTTPKNNNNNNNNNSSSSSSSKKKKKKRQDTCTPRNNNNNNNRKKNNNNNNSSSNSGKKKKQQEQEETAVAVIPKHVYNAKRRYWQLFRAFCTVVEEDFIKNDKHLGEVVASIENVRRCIHATSRQQYSDNNAVYPMWQQYGYRSSTRDESTFSTITWLDIEETLTHDMQQHERLLSGLGSLLKQLYEAQEAMGRRLEDMYNHHLDVTMDTNNSSILMTDDDIHVCVYLGDCAVLLEKMQDCHHACANELFRKQGLCGRLFDSCTDDLLDESSSSSSSNESLSKRVAEQCARECLETNCIHLQSWQEICALKKG